MVLFDSFCLFAFCDLGPWIWSELHDAIVRKTDRSGFFKET